MQPIKVCLSVDNVPMHGLIVTHDSDMININECMHLPRVGVLLVKDNIVEMKNEGHEGETPLMLAILAARISELEALLIESQIDFPLMELGKLNPIKV